MAVNTTGKTTVTDSSLQLYVPSWNAAAGTFLHKLTTKHENGNILISPFSLCQAFMMACNGGTEATQQELLSVLQLKKDANLADINDKFSHLSAFLTSASSNTFLCANSMWLTPALEPNKEYLKLLTEKYLASLKALKDPKEVDAWVSEATKGKITSIGPLDPSTELLLINAIYFKGAFAEAFDETKTEKNKKFTTFSGSTVDLSLMARSASWQYAETKDYQATILPYVIESGKPQFECLVFLPKDTKARPSSLFDKIMKDGSFNVTFSKKKGLVKLPRFSLEFEEREFLDILKDLGMKSNSFPGIASQPLMINMIIHKTTMEMNEKGTVATAVTAVSMMRSLAHVPESRFEMIVDRPFLVVIREVHSHSILFLGEINEPTAL